MISLEKIRDLTLRLPDVVEGPPVKAARRIAAFKVNGKSFLGIEAGEKLMTLSFDPEQAASLQAKSPDMIQLVTGRQGHIVGIRINLEHASISQIAALVEASWRHTKETHGRVRRSR